MKKKKLLLLLSILSVLTTSCDSILQTTRTNTSKTLDIYGAGVVHNTVIVDLDVKETKINGLAEGFSSIEEAKQNAIVDALKKAEADVLVEPKFETETVNGKVSAEVTGFPATYKNFRPIKEQDLKLLEAGVTQKAVVHEPIEVSNKTEKAKGGSAAKYIVGIAVIFILVLLGTR